MSIPYDSQQKPYDSRAKAYDSRRGRPAGRESYGTGCESYGFDIELYGLGWLAGGLRVEIGVSTDAGAWLGTAGWNRTDTDSFESELLMTTPGKRLTRSTTDKMIGGVCGGLAEYFGWSASLVRVLFVASCLLPGPQFLLYVLLWVFIPKK